MHRGFNRPHTDRVWANISLESQRGRKFRAREELKSSGFCVGHQGPKQVTLRKSKCSSEILPSPLTQSPGHKEQCSLPAQINTESCPLQGSLSTFKTGGCLVLHGRGVAPWLKTRCPHSPGERLSSSALKALQSMDATSEGLTRCFHSTYPSSVFVAQKQLQDLNLEFLHH